MIAGYVPHPESMQIEGKQPTWQPATNGTPVIIPGTNSEEEEFGAQKLGFSTERRSNAYRWKMLVRTDDSYESWIVRFLNMIGKLAQIPGELRKAHLLMVTWKDLFIEHPTKS